MSEPFAIVPVRGIAAGKSRLAPVLDEAARARFNEWLLTHTLGALRAWRGNLDACLVVSACERALAIAKSHGAQTLKEDGVSGLNAAARAGVRFAAARGATSALVLPCDLPDIDAEALAAFALDAKPGEVTIAPDQSGTGTNAIEVPADADLEFCFGSGSFARHAAAAAARGLGVVLHRSAALAFDIDTPDDYARWHAALGKGRAKPMV